MSRLIRYAPALVLLAIAAAVAASGGLQNFSLESLQDHRAAWTATAEARPLLSLVAFVAAFAVLGGAGLPVAMMLTLASGLVFGALLGGLATAVGATAAALVTYAAARFALANWVQDQIPAGGRLETLVDTLRTEGFWYLVSARMMPVFPFNLVNIACGVAGVPLGRYVAATVTAAIPTSLIYAGLGSGLGEGLSAGEMGAALRSPTIYAALAGLAAVSLIPALLRRYSANGNSSLKASS
jgi:uncharacterized membrane protein YdjX (TVP38/TMEM64 family)